MYGKYGLFNGDAGNNGKISLMAQSDNDIEKTIGQSMRNDIPTTMDNIKKNFNIESFIRECIYNKINEELYDANHDTHFAILKPINKIVFSWDYSDYDNSELRQFKNDYFVEDIKDNGFNPKDIKILTRKACERMGLNPADESNWSNGFD